MTAGAHTSINGTARRAGVLYLSLLPFGIFSFVYVPSVLLVRGDTAATSSRILASETLFRSATISHLISQVIVVFLVLTLYRIFSPVNQKRAVLMVVLALLCVPISFLNEVHNLVALRALRADDGVFTTTQLQAQAMLFLDMARDGVLIAQVFWGLWMLPLAFLIFRSQFLPRFLGVTVLITGVGYLVDSCLQLMSPGAPMISKPTILAELALPLWLVIKRVDAERWQQVARASPDRPGAAP